MKREDLRVEGVCERCGKPLEEEPQPGAYSIHAALEYIIDGTWDKKYRPCSCAASWPEEIELTGTAARKEE